MELRKLNLEGRTMSEIHTDKAFYYVSAIDGAKRYLLAGPYTAHETALARVDAVNAYACANDPRAHFMAWGTAGSDETFKTPLGEF